MNTDENTNENTNSPAAADESVELNSRLAYVLGEATEAERTALAGQMQSDPTVSREIAELQHLAAAATLEVRTAPNPERSGDLRQSLELRFSEIETQTPVPPQTDARRRRNRRLWLAFVGGSLCVAGIALSPMFDFSRQSQDVANADLNRPFNAANQVALIEKHPSTFNRSSELLSSRTARGHYDPSITTTTVTGSQGSAPGGATSNGFGQISRPTATNPSTLPHVGGLQDALTDFESPLSENAGYTVTDRSNPSKTFGAKGAVDNNPASTTAPAALSSKTITNTHSSSTSSVSLAARPVELRDSKSPQRKPSPRADANGNFLELNPGSQLDQLDVETQRQQLGAESNNKFKLRHVHGYRPEAQAGDTVDNGELRERLSQIKVGVLSDQEKLARDEKPRIIVQEEENERLNYSNYGTEQYRPITDNSFLATEGEQALSTFSVDVDTASYANVRRFLQGGQLAPPDAVRIEELLNYFSYQYPQPADKHPFAVHMETAACPWNDEHRLVRIGIKGREIAKEKRPASNLVFLIDVSGSMTSDDKLPLLKKGLSLLVKELTEDDRVTIITYAGDAGEKLPTTNGTDKQKILAAIEALHAGGSTNGSAGIQLAYEKAKEHFIPGGTNRVLWATDGDLNVGVTGDAELVELVKEKAKSGVFVSVLGFGTGNLKDGKLEQIADNGNGVYVYIDSLREARKVLVEQMSGSLVTIAKDVKLQVEFNPAEVASYRLIGYENRVLATQDFNNDKKDAGDIGAGHTVTALYEIVPASKVAPQPEKKLELKYQKTIAKQPETKPTADAAESGELLTLKLRYKKPDENHSQLLEMALKNNSQRFTAASADFQFASAVASFGMILRGSPYRGSSTFDQIIETASTTLSEDAGGYRAEFVDLVRKAKEIGK